MRSPTRRAVAWVAAAAAAVGAVVVGIGVLAPGDAPTAEAPPPSAQAPRPTATTVGPAPTEAPTTAGPTTTVARSPVPEVVVGAVGELVSLNAASTAGRTPVGVLASSPVLPSAFVVDAKGVPVQNHDLLADVQVVPGPPMSVVYRIADVARWSDGTPITCDDFQLAWLAGRGSRAQDGTPLFASAASGYETIGRVSCAGKSATVVFDRPNPGWQLLFSSLVPAHVVLGARGLQSADLARAAQGEPLTLIALSQAWNDAYVLAKGLPAVSGGPFVPTEWVPGQRLVLSRNPSWWGARPSLDTVVVRLFADADSAVRAFAAGEVQVVGALPAGAARAAAAVPGGQVRSTSGATFDHLVVNFRNPLFQDRQVREALAQCVPRERIATRLADVGEGTGAVLDDHLRVPFQARYQPDGVDRPVFDVAASRATLERDGWSRGSDGVYRRSGKPFSFRLLRDDSPRSAVIADEIVAACRDAGIAVADDAVGADERDTRVRNGDFDVVLASNRVRLSPTGAQGMFGTRAAENLGDYSSSAVDELFIALASVQGQAAQDELMARIDALLWTDLPTLPLTQPPLRTAVADRVQGVEPNPTVSGLLWNVTTWQVQRG